MPIPKISFSTLACPDWTLLQAIGLANSAHYEGLELRFLENEDSLWKLPCFRGNELNESRRRIAEAGLKIVCVDTSCRFDSPSRTGREAWLTEGQRMAELAAELGAPGIRVFGDRIQPGADRPSTRAWIAESLAALADRISDTRVQVWLETHGDFSGASEVRALLAECAQTGIVWDAVSAFVECGERPLANGRALHEFIRHVHIKDVRGHNDDWLPALTGEGGVPLVEIHQVLEEIAYDGFVSFEWEKKWHPAIEPAEIAVPHFAQWFRKNWEQLDASEGLFTPEVRP